MIEDGDLSEEAQKEPQEEMDFRLDRLVVSKERTDDNPCWFSDSSTPSDWFYE